MTQPVDQTQLEEFLTQLTEARDMIAEAISSLDANPPESDDEFIARKNQLMNTWRDLSIFRVQMLPS